MMAVMLHAMLTERLGEGAVQVRSSGFGPVDLPAIDDAVDAMRRRGHRRVGAPQLGDHPGTRRRCRPDPHSGARARREGGGTVALAFRRALTLPEFLVAATVADEHPSVDVRSWVQSLTEHRTAGEYLRAAVPEVADPTGWLPRAFESAVVVLEQQCRETATHVAVRFGEPPR
jgi:hypothetical protein